MQVLVAGGGTAGHVSPLVAISAELKLQKPGTAVVFVGFRGDKHLHESIITKESFVREYTITAGKLRRYHGVALWRQLIDLPTIFLNIRDVFRLIRGTLSAVRIMRNERPDVVFAKGGFVSVPVSVAAKITNTPLVTHDSDALPGLANRIASKWADKIATGAPLHHYHYPKKKMVEVGVPTDDIEQAKDYTPQKLIKEFKLKKDLPVVAVVGGTLGGRPINHAVLSVLDELEELANVIHVAGSSNYKEVSRIVDSQVRKSYHLEEIVPHNKLMQIFKGSDLVVSRVGASTMAELAILSTATILIPNPHLTGGHQLKNAQRYAQEGAAVVVKQGDIQNDPKVLLSAIKRLLQKDSQRRRLEKKISQLARPNATEDLARIIIESAERG